MELRHLRGFVAVAGTGSVNGAATALGLAPASVSEQIRRLEGTLQVKLFDRTPHGMRLTEQGTILLSHAQELLDHAERVRRAVTGTRRRVRIGALESLVATRLPAVVRKLSDLDVHVRALPRRELLEEVAEGGLDAALLLDSGLRIGGLGFDSPPGLDFIDVGQVSLIMVAAPESEEDTLLTTPPGCSIRMAVDRIFPGDVPRRELTSISTAREWSRQGLGRSLLPDFAVEADLASGALVPLGFDAPTLSLRLVWLRSRESSLRDVLYALSG
ncbi:LysR family transcriptional regulator [Nonomuraea sediminis]|uniref:LysR family transcriptional regulator n=1 Tax=Nonomuraea sediminis TaxID=2835864 RepID=UPI0027E0F635|nr:LysR family transcriptional regulator [Nonomuraea sediminis]